MTLTVSYLSSLPLGSAVREFAKSQGEEEMSATSEPWVRVTGASCSNCDLPLDGRKVGGKFPFEAKFSDVQGWNYDHKPCGGERSVHITMEPIDAADWVDAVD